MTTDKNIISLLQAGRIYTRNESGTATMEFVIGLPLLMIAMIFVFEFSNLFWSHHIAVNNVRSAVRYLSRAPLSEPYLTQAENIAKTGAPDTTTGAYEWMNNITVNVDENYSSFSDSDFRTSGNIIRIVASVPYQFQTFSLFNTLSGGNASSALTMVVAEEARHFGE